MKFAKKVSMKEMILFNILELRRMKMRSVIGRKDVFLSYAHMNIEYSRKIKVRRYKTAFMLYMHCTGSTQWGWIFCVDWWSWYKSWSQVEKWNCRWHTGPVCYLVGYFCVSHSLLEDVPMMILWIFMETCESSGFRWCTLHHGEIYMKYDLPVNNYMVHENNLKIMNSCTFHSHLIFIILKLSLG